MKESTSSGYAVVAGHISLDITPGLKLQNGKNFSDVFLPGKLINIEGVELATGGVVSNTGVALKVLGVPVRLMAKIGNDTFGNIVTAILKEKEVDNALSIVDGVQTSYTIVIVSKNIDRLFLHDPGANHTFGMKDIDFDIVKDAKIFHFGYPTIMRNMYINDGAEIIEIFKKVKRMNVTTSLDLCVPDPASEAGQVNWIKLLEGLLPYVDIFAPSIEEILFMIDRPKYDELNELANGKDMLEVLDLQEVYSIGQKVLDMGSKIAIIKCGKLGCYIRTQGKEVMCNIGSIMLEDLDNWSNREIFEEPYIVPELVSATGAGDAFIAGFIGALMNGKKIQESMKLASATSAECIQTYDALSGLKSIDETEQLIRRGIRKKTTIKNTDYWLYDDVGQCWLGKNDLHNKKRD